MKSTSHSNTSLYIIQQKLSLFKTNQLKNFFKEKKKWLTLGGVWFGPMMPKNLYALNGWVIFFIRKTQPHFFPQSISIAFLLQSEYFSVLVISVKGVFLERKHMILPVATDCSWVLFSSTSGLISEKKRITNISNLE